MAATTEAVMPEPLNLPDTASLATGAGGIALVVLGILALAGVETVMLLSIAVIVGGVVVLTSAASISSRYARALRVHGGHSLDASALSDGMSAGILAGGGGIVLGILSILGIVPGVLIAVAVIIFGGALLFDFAARTQIRALRMTNGEDGGQSARVALAAASSTSTASVLIAVALITLGILALARLDVDVLMAVAFLALGTYLFLEGTAITRWLFDMMVF